MSVEIHSTTRDDVIDSYFLTGKTNYGFALENFYPLVGRFEAQRKFQDKKFYKRLRRDINLGCVMPPITIAFVSENKFRKEDIDSFSNFINENIDEAYILDGMQRLNTLNLASEEEGFDPTRDLFVNILISKSTDKLLYRMITLNNGQRPMTPRHQIEVLTQELFDFKPLENIQVQTEKERAEKIIRGAFNLGDISNAYLAYLTNSVHNENNKIIDEKMNEILVGRVLDNDLSKNSIEFKDVLNEVDRLSSNTEAKRWFKLNNNLIGFSVGVKESYDIIKSTDPADFADFVNRFDEAFEAINPSKVNVGKYRRDLSRDVIENISELFRYDQDDLTVYLVDKTTN